MNPIGVVLGSGLGAFADTLANRFETPYADIAGWPATTAVGHAGKLVTGLLGDIEVVVLSGRAHYYEGYTGAEVTLEANPDGVTESRNKAGECYDIDRLTGELQRLHDRPASTIVTTIAAAAWQWAGTPKDDVSLMAVKRS